MEQLNLSTLPPDIIREIIRVGLESIESMRMISPQWNKIALDYLTFRDRLPVIKAVDWESASKYWSMALQIPRQYREFFGVENWPKQGEFSPETLWVCEDLFKTTAKRENLLACRLSRIFARCSGIEKLTIAILGDTQDIINRVLRDTRIEIVHFSTNDEFEFSNHSSGMLDLIRANSIQAMTLKLPKRFLWGLEWKNLITFLNVATESGTTVELTATKFVMDPDFYEARVDGLNSTGNFSAKIVEKKHERYHEVIVRIVVEPKEN